MALHLNNMSSLMWYGDGRLHQVHLDDSRTVVIADNLDIKADEHGLLEYRVFVIDGQIRFISRAVDDKNMPLGVGNDLPIPADIRAQVSEKVPAILSNPEFPTTFCVDFFEYTDATGKSQFDICEFNPLESSGLFVSGSLMRNVID